VPEALDYRRNAFWADAAYIDNDLIAAGAGADR
jgi:hypothetical protein